MTEGKESSNPQTKYRIVKAEYEYDTYQEEPGSITDVIQHERKSVIRTGSHRNPNELDAVKLDMDDQHYPKQDYNDETGPQVGDSDFSYTLEELKDRKWKYVKSLHPFHVEEPEDEPLSPEDMEEPDWK